MTHYKAFDKDLCCRKLQYTIGGTTTVEGELEKCKNGIHCCKQVLSCLNYYPPTSRFCVVSPEGDRITEGNMTVCRGLTVVREIVGDELSTLLTGRHQEWHKNGHLKIDCTYEDGKKEGPYKQWFEDGQLREEVTYKNGGLDGLWREWCKNGQLIFERTMNNGGLDGSYKSWYDNGQPRMEGSYEDGKQDGTQKDWYRNGNLHHEYTLIAASIDGLFRAWHENGQPAHKYTYKDGKLDGPYRSWYPNGQLYVECTYKDDKKEVSVLEQPIVGA